MSFQTARSVAFIGIGFAVGSILYFFLTRQGKTPEVGIATCVTNDDGMSASVRCSTWVESSLDTESSVVVRCGGLVVTVGANK